MGCKGKYFAFFSISTLKPQNKKFILEKPYDFRTNPYDCFLSGNNGNVLCKTLRKVLAYNRHSSSYTKCLKAYAYNRAKLVALIFIRINQPQYPIR